MIRYALACQYDHTFEGWFGSSGDYDDQSDRGLLACPVCGSTAVEKQVMAPAVSGTKSQPPPADLRQMMMEVRRHVEETFDDVGDGFSDEARAIHEGRSEDRGIYGQATGAEVRKLIEDGVPVAPMPPAVKAKGELN